MGDNDSRFIAAAKEKGSVKKLMGFGHKRMEGTAQSDANFVERKLYRNVEINLTKHRAGLNMTTDLSAFGPSTLAASTPA